ncbi:hypothetical protein GHT06_015172 [Daphnia sinensis]|uniref:Uncharacterized protein n=1 Tax=Daphnia sinensis TaxID=1820382 RepID=A0AAD5LIM4_9CRUS|nr:hypothetical protein GHT06_015172 [Daphnia sinensis]
MVFGHQTRSIIPAHRKAFADKWKIVMNARDRQADIDAAVKTRYDAHAKPLSRLSIGAQVRTQDPKSKKWIGSFDGSIPDGGSSDATAPSGDRTASPHGDTRKQSDERETQTVTHPPQVRRCNIIFFCAETDTVGAERDTIGAETENISAET